MFLKSLYIKYFYTDITDSNVDDIININLNFPVKVGNIYIIVDEISSLGKFEISFYEKNKNQITLIDPARHILFKKTKYEEWFMDFIPPFNLKKFTVYDNEVYEIIRHVVKMNRLKVFL
jgi:hypothetical protein